MSRGEWAVERANRSWGPGTGLIFDQNGLPMQSPPPPGPANDYGSGPPDGGEGTRKYLNLDLNVKLLNGAVLIFLTIIGGMLVWLDSKFDKATDRDYEISHRIDGVAADVAKMVGLLERRENGRGQSQGRAEAKPVR